MVCERHTISSIAHELAVRHRLAIEESSPEISATARGVEARLRLLTGFSRLVAQQSVDIARQLNIPEREIRQWAAELESERDRIIQATVDKVCLPRD